jgi:predicted transposase YbfD/YdcC
LGLGPSESVFHGRDEERSYYLAKLPEDSTLNQKWPTVRAIGLACRLSRDAQGRESCETRYYLVSKYVSGKRFAAAVRGHWAIENSLHWQLDVTFGEDQCRLRQGYSDQNFSHVRKLVLALLKQDKTAQCGIKNKRLRAGWDDDYRLQVLRA